MPSERDFPGGDADLDAAFAEIVAGWDDISTDPVPRWPAAEDVQPHIPNAENAPAAPATAEVDPFTDLSPDRARRDRGEGRDLVPEPYPTPEPAAGPRDWELASDTDGHFEPPDPPPLPRTDVRSRLAWAAVVLGAAFLVFAGLFWRDVARLWLALATAALVGGFVALVLRLPQSRNEDDDGAVL